MEKKIKQAGKEKPKDYIKIFPRDNKSMRTAMRIRYALN